ncbi:MAG: hypothetical protein ABR514_07015 [Chthoniobacterales bacterium]
MIAYRLIALVVLLAAFSPTPAVFELRDVDLSLWDCMTKPAGSARSPDGQERNQQKNRPPLDLTGAKIAAFDTAGFLAHVAEYDRQLQAKNRREMNAAQKAQLENFEKEIVSLTGWVVFAYQGLPETTNCKSDQFLDWHLEVFAQSADHPPRVGDATPIICEITPRIEGPLYRSGVRIQNLVGFLRLPDNSVQPAAGKSHQVRITGYLMWDDEHAGTNDVGETVQRFRPKGWHNPWRSTAWEIHPVMKVDDLGPE